MIPQSKTIKMIKDTFDDYIIKNKTKVARIRYLKIHGGSYQEKGLPDLMVLLNMFASKKRRCKELYWFEIKNSWSDIPSALQQYNIREFRSYGFITGYVVGDEYKKTWLMQPIKLKELLNENL